MQRGLATISCGSLMVLAACASTPHGGDDEAPNQQSRAEGVVSYEQVVDPEAVRPVADVHQEYVRPALHPKMPLPTYPEEMLVAEAPPTKVVVRVVVGADGSVTSVRPSPLADTPPGEWHSIFFEAVRKTVSNWRYEPCRLQKVTDGPDRNGDGKADYKILASSTPMEIYLDLAFQFEIVDGAGSVAMGGHGGD